MNNSRQKIKTGLFTILATLIAFYILFQSKNLILGPQISLSEPADGATLSYNLVTVQGTTRNVTSVAIDDRPISIDNQGVFSEKLIAPPGYSIIKVTGQDRFGKKVSKFIHVYLPVSEVVPTLETVSATSTATTSVKGILKASTTDITH